MSMISIFRPLRGTNIGRAGRGWFDVNYRHRFVLLGVEDENVVEDEDGNKESGNEMVI